MDPFTHALVGIGLTYLTGEKFSFANPVHIGTVLGALAPDLDIVLQFFGDLPYLKHHRGVSHSLPAIILESAVIALILWSFLPVNLSLVFLWSFLGAVSHIIMDIFNSYGAKPLWPFSNKQFTLNLLILADPVIIGLFGLSLLGRSLPGVTGKIVLLCFSIYIFIRYLMRKRAVKKLSLYYKKFNTPQIVVMPAMASIWKWSFLVETAEIVIVGEYNFFTAGIVEKKLLNKVPATEITQKAYQSKLGKLFRSFTPYFHICHTQEDGKHVVRFCDLRYFFREEFLHNATVIFDETHDIIEAVFQPYSKKRKIRIL